MELPFVSRKKYNELVYKLECLLCHATGGRLSKAGYSLKDMCLMVDEHIDRCIDELPRADVVEIPEGGIGNLSDGYHTFNELYHHRAVLFSVICNMMPEKAWKSRLHDTGDMYEGMFIVGIETPEGQATYHYDVEPYWNMFKVKELERAPKWDGHTPQDAIDRISKISADVVEVVHARWNEDGRCSNCDWYMPFDCEGNGVESEYCPNCGAKMDGERKENGT